MVRKRLRISPYYPINNVKEAVKQGYYRIEPEAWDEMRDDFGWGTNDIEKFFSKLAAKHWHKTDKMKRKIPKYYCGELPIMLDIYHVKNVHGENVYTHFYFEDDRLIIDSLHELD